MVRKTILFLSLILSFSFVGISQENASAEGEIGIFERLDTYVPDDIMIINEQGDTVNLKSLIDRPTVVSFVYFRCPGICSPFMDGVADVVSSSEMVLGEDFNIITISFDHTENTQLAISKKQNYINTIRKEVNPDGWQFFTADSINVVRATQAFGFKYKKTGFDFLHAAGMMIVSPDGKITRYLHGIYFLPFDLKLAVIEASQGKSGPSINRVLAYCYSYDPEGQRYVMNITKVAGTLIIFFSLVIFLVLILKPKSKRNSK